ncbi:MAG: hypothetical protein ABSC63_13670 [Candidatus Binataceae bacterium]|jgi:hypothetical protein
MKTTTQNDEWHDTHHEEVETHYTQTIKHLNTFDEELPLLPEARECFRWQLAPLIQVLFQRSVQREDLECVDLVRELSELLYIIMSFTTGNEKPVHESHLPLRRSDLAPKDRDWKI